MKKTYIAPQMSTTTLTSTYTLCSQSLGGNGVPTVSLNKAAEASEGGMAADSRSGSFWDDEE